MAHESAPQPVRGVTSQTELILMKRLGIESKRKNPIFIGMDRELLEMGTLPFFFTFKSSFRCCHGDCQLSWHWWEYHLVWKLDYNEVKGSLGIK